jgi:hypothetical protein
MGDRGSVARSRIVTGMFLAQAFCFAWSGWAACSLFRIAGASWGLALSVAETEGEHAFLFAAMGVLFYLAPRLRTLIAAVGIIAGIYSAFWMSRSFNFLGGSLNPLHGNIIALSMWSEIIMVALGLVCAVELVFLMRARRIRN